MYHSFLDLMKKEGPVIGLIMHFFEPSVVEYAKDAGFDYIRIDTEHEMFNYKDIRELARVATLLDMPCHIRVSNLNDVARFLDCGITGIFVTDVNSVERGKAAIDAVKMYPLGARGQYPAGRCVRFANCDSFQDYVKVANDIVMLTFQIESVAALPFLDDILSLPGVDMVASGKADTAQSMGKPGRSNDPDVTEVENIIIRKTLEHGKIPVIGIRGPEKLQGLMDMGVKVFSCGPDEEILTRAMKSFIRECRRTITE